MKAQAWQIAVVVGVALLVAFASVRLFVISDTGWESQPKGRAQTDVRTIHRVAEQYRRSHGGACVTVAALRTAKELDTSAVDPWGSGYEIRCSEDATYGLSFGPDAKEGTADDIRAPPL